MKENKFKFWDTQEKKFIETVYKGREKNIVEPYITANGEVKIRTFNHVEFYEEQIIAIQYTGLLDIKGNKIFDKDLIKDDENFIWEVFYKSGAFYAKCDDLMAEQLLSSVNLYGVVIGNVFEKEDGHEGN